MGSKKVLRRYLGAGWAYNPYWEDNVRDKWFEIDTFDGENTHLPLWILYDHNYHRETEDTPITIRAQYENSKTAHYIRSTLGILRALGLHTTTPTEFEKTTITGTMGHVATPEDVNSGKANEVVFQSVEADTTPGLLVSFNNTTVDKTGCEVFLTPEQNLNLWATIELLLTTLFTDQDPTNRVPLGKDILPSGQRTPRR